MALSRVAISVAALILTPSVAHALTQPDGTPIPTPLGCYNNQPSGLAAVFACICDQPNICNIGATCPDPNNCDDGQHANCETTLFHSFNDNTCIPSNLTGLDPYTQASTQPETFHPTCAQTYTLRSRGTALFKNAFGWYNVVNGAPSLDDLHVMLDCNAAPGDAAVLDLANEPAWLGGDIGFFLVTPESHAQKGTCAGGDCCATVARVKGGEGYAYYSQRDNNPDFAGASSYIHLLIYDSLVFPQTYYFAFEDIYGGSNNDFTDFVASVSGIECPGGGVACDTGQPGICGFGVTVCDAGVVLCQPLFGPSAEVCNGLDDDCDGLSDVAASCPNADDVCNEGNCVPHCAKGEFPCTKPGTQCDPGAGLCVDDDCVGVNCPTGEICHQGTCVAPCEDVVCPYGQECVGDACLDLCAGVTCGSGQVCSRGKCFGGCATCDGIPCEAPLACDEASGTCVDPSCATPCPDGTHCAGGLCVDDCQGAVCPLGQLCSGGNCVDAGAGGSGSTSTGISTGEGGSGAGDATTGAGGNGGGGSADDPLGGDAGCTCRLGAAAPEPRAAGVWGVALGLVAWGLRRARGRRPKRATGRERAA